MPFFATKPVTASGVSAAKVVATIEHHDLRGRILSCCRERDGNSKYLGIGIYYSRRARGSTTEFFLSGRDVLWWRLPSPLIRHWPSPALSRKTASQETGSGGTL